VQSPLAASLPNWLPESVHLLQFQCFLARKNLNGDSYRLTEHIKKYYRSTTI